MLRVKRAKGTSLHATDVATKFDRRLTALYDSVGSAKMSRSNVPNFRGPVQWVSASLSSMVDGKAHEFLPGCVGGGDFREELGSKSSRQVRSSTLQAGILGIKAP